MKFVELEPDVYAHILKNAVEIGESASSILRRLLGIKQSTEPPSSLPTSAQTAIQKHLQSTEFRFAAGVVGKFLSVLKVICQEYPSDFQEVEKIRGRGRLYFSRDVDALRLAGTNVNPKQIPNSSYWVITNTSTVLKQELLTQVMQTFHYSPTETQDVLEAIKG